jgi:hypothetical protein
VISTIAEHRVVAILTGTAETVKSIKKAKVTFLDHSIMLRI